MENFKRIAEQVKLLKAERNKLLTIIEPILKHEKWAELSTHPHHIDESRSDHSLQVCCTSWKMARNKHDLDLDSLAIGSILHDFFLYDWTDQVIDNSSLMAFYTHLCKHLAIAYITAKQYFSDLMNVRIKDIITKHMFPLPVGSATTYPESWIVTLADKKVSYGYSLPRRVKQLLHDPRQ